MNNVCIRAHSAEKDDLRGSVGKNILTELCLSGKIPMSNYNYEEDAIIVQPIEEYPFKEYRRNDDGKVLTVIRSIDLVYVVSPGKYAAAKGDCFTVGVEIKTRGNDIMRDPTQIPSYLGQTHYFFLAVPARLVNMAMESFKNQSNVGVMDMTNRKIVRFPKRQLVSESAISTMLYRSVFSKRVLPIMCFRPSKKE